MLLCLWSRLCGWVRGDEGERLCLQQKNSITPLGANPLSAFYDGLTTRPKKRVRAVVDRHDTYNRVLVRWRTDFISEFLVQSRWRAVRSLVFLWVYDYDGVLSSRGWKELNRKENGDMGRQRDKHHGKCACTQVVV